MLLNCFCSNLVSHFRINEFNASAATLLVFSLFCIITTILKWKSAPKLITGSYRPILSGSNLLHLADWISTYSVELNVYSHSETKVFMLYISVCIWYFTFPSCSHNIFHWENLRDSAPSFTEFKSEVVQKTTEFSLSNMWLSNNILRHLSRTIPSTKPHSDQLI